MHYLSGTRALKLGVKPDVATGANPVLISYNDADYVVDKANRKSLTGTIILPNGMSVSWFSKY